MEVLVEVRVKVLVEVWRTWVMMAMKFVSITTNPRLVKCGIASSRAFSSCWVATRSSRL